MGLIWHNGTFIKDTPILSINDRLRLGEAVFNTMLVIDGTIHHIHAHMDKLLHDGDIMFGHWTKPDIKTLETAAQELLQKNNETQGQFALNTFITGGPSRRGLHDPEQRSQQIIIRTTPLPDSFPPVHAMIAQNIRRNEGSPLSQIKCCNYGENILALREAKNKGANEAILLNNAGYITCATTANIAIIKDRQILTPPVGDGINPGITRAHLIKKYGAKEQSLRPEDLKSAQGIYIMNSLRGVLPVISLDGEDLPEPTIQIPQYFHLEE